MRFSAAAAALLSVGAAVAQTTHVVSVGGGGNLSYTPNSLSNVANGDIIQFQFLEKNHTVTQSTFGAPCSNITDASGAVTGVDSGFQFVNTSATQFPVWQITINNASAPLWFYCRQANALANRHCQAGMVFAVNPTAAKTFDMFKSAAALSTAVDGSAASGASTGASGSSAPAAASGTGAAAGTVGTGSAASTPSPSATSAGGAGNGAASMTFSGATILSLVGLSFGLLL
uniref:Non-specific serine/threonine protein kinase (EC) n=1 Tax=Ganoderma boninense TaxID=34458 RepID=A0A5K1K493_9APHY|nr:Non-specific serine/threonine protein kinase (EC [Ganoderma boninense]